MSFIWPWMLVPLVLVPVGVFLYRRLQQRRQRDAVHLGTLGLVRDSGAKPLGRRRHIPAILFLLGLTLLLLAIARPQMELPLPQREGIVILAIDVSASMAASDLEPTRMVAAKAAAQAFVEKQPRNIKIGVVAFSDGGLVVQTPTDDRAAISATIGRLAPQSGTSLGRGILAALNAVSAVPDTGESDADSAQAAPGPQPAPRGAFAPAVIVLLTDGENTAPPDPLEAAQMAIEQGVRIHTVGIGSRTGTTVEIDGFNVFTLLNEDTLKEIAMLTEGEYFSADDTDSLRKIYENLDLRFEVKTEKTEITSILGGVSMLVLLIGGLLSLIWFGRMP